MRITATAEFMLEPAFFPVEPNKDAGSSRDAIGLGQRAGKGLNTRHGTILTLEDISVSFDGFRALNNLNLYIGVGELLLFLLDLVILDGGFEHAQRRQPRRVPGTHRLFHVRRDLIGQHDAVD